MSMLFGQVGNAYNELRTWKTFQMALTIFLSKELLPWNTGAEKRGAGVQSRSSHYSWPVKAETALRYLVNQPIEIPGRRALHPHKGRPNRRRAHWNRSKRQAKLCHRPEGASQAQWTEIHIRKRKSASGQRQWIAQVIGWVTEKR